MLLAPFVRDLLFDTSARDPATYVGVVCILLPVGVLAAAIPAWRATRIDPDVALRTER